MTRLQEKAQGHTKQAVGQMIGDDELVLEGKDQVRKADEQPDEKPRAQAQKTNAKESAAKDQTRR